MELGVCYYPEQITEKDVKAQITKDLETMKTLGITWVRIGEFAWSTVEPSRDQFEWATLDHTMDEAARLGVKIVLGTPTATPPKWLIDEAPLDILLYDEKGMPRKFGSRRHYSFSSKVYAKESARIVHHYAKRYGAHPALQAWQTDNEYGCHETTYCYSPAAQAAFREWLEQKYKTIDALNDSWGTAFWSQTYRTFAEIDLPASTVTVPHQAHVLDFRRFSSDQVKAFNRIQTDILREHTKDSSIPIIHNFMGAYTDFDHFEVSEDLDCVSWDNYPIGFLSEIPSFPAEHKKTFYDKGDPDLSALHHDLYRSMGKRGWWIMELQPGTVNWARHNPLPYRDRKHPHISMQRLWAWEAFAHGADVVSYFRFRQNARAQEQMHAGLLFPDGRPAPAAADARQIRDEIDTLIKKIPNLASSLAKSEGESHSPTTQISSAGTNLQKIFPNIDRAEVAILYDYPSLWSYEIDAQSQGFSFLTETYKWYRALRGLGLRVDFIAGTTHDLPGGLDALKAYGTVILPTNAILPEKTLASLNEFVTTYNGTVIIGSRSGTLDEAFVRRMPKMPLEKDLLAQLTGVQVDLHSSLPPGVRFPVTFETPSNTSTNPSATQSANQWATPSAEKNYSPDALQMSLWVEEGQILPSADTTTASTPEMATTIASFSHGGPAITLRSFTPQSPNHDTNPPDHDNNPQKNAPASDVKTPDRGQCYRFYGLPSEALICHFITGLEQTRLFKNARQRDGLAPSQFPLPPGVRTTAYRGLYFAFNYGPTSVELAFTKASRTRCEFLIGESHLHPGDLCVWHMT